MLESDEMPVSAFLANFSFTVSTWTEHDLQRDSAKATYCAATAFFLGVSLRLGAGWDLTLGSGFALTQRG